MSKKISVIIPTMPGREELLKKLLDSLPKDCQTIIVKDEHLLLAAKRNKGARLATGSHFLFIDDDNYVAPGSIERMFNAFYENVGVVGMVACYDDKPDTIADGGSKRNYVSGFMKGVNTNAKILEIDQDPYEVDEVANAFMIPRHIFKEVKGFDEVNFPIDLDEADICKRIKNMHYRVMMNPRSVCYHKSQTYSCIPDFRRPRNAYFMGRNRVLYQKKHLSKSDYLKYILLFFPLFVISYCAALIYRGKIDFIYYFMKGVEDGLQNRRSNSY